MSGDVDAVREHQDAFARHAGRARIRCAPSATSSSSRQHRRASPVIYLAGNSLGLQPRKARRRMCTRSPRGLGASWASRATSTASHPWLPYHELLTEQTARLVGAQPLGSRGDEHADGEPAPDDGVVLPAHAASAPKILIEGGRLPLGPVRGRVAGALPRLRSRTRRSSSSTPRAGRGHAAPRGHPRGHRAGRLQTVALVLLGNVNYLTGQAFDIAAITRAAHAQGCRVGFDLAHGAGNLQALRCMTTGPTSPCGARTSTSTAARARSAACFVHERHAQHVRTSPRFAGWWGHDKADALPDGPRLRAASPAPRAGSCPTRRSSSSPRCAPRWSCSTGPRWRRCARRASGSPATSSSCSTGSPKASCASLTPREPERRGAQLSLRFTREPKRSVGDARRRRASSATSASPTSSAPRPRRCTTASWTCSASSRCSNAHARD